MQPGICEISDSIELIDGLGQSPFIKGPKGITIHYSADGSFERVKRELFATKIGYHFLIKKDGKIIQTAKIDRCVNHAGKALWNEQSPNRTHIAVAFICWGLLSKEGKTWNGLQIENPVTRRGFTWEPATKEQEEALRRLCKYLMATFKISAKDICGHDECAIPAGRKVDPGGSLLKSMADLRAELLGGIG